MPRAALRRAPGAAALLLTLGAAVLVAPLAAPAAAQQRPAATLNAADRYQRALSELEFREIGPAIMGGRVSDLAVNQADPAEFYVGLASGGLWKTTSQGMTWTPLFDDQPNASVGAVTLAPSNPNIVWVGTGEPQNRQSSPYGAGVFRSTDAGLTWQSMGLEDTRHIGRIVIHPRDPDIVYVAAVGHLFGPNEERGVFRTTDGGETWDKVLYRNEHTGVIDLVMDPGDPRTLFAATYQRQRTAFGFSASGGGGGIWRTTDGGETWSELTDGLPAGEKGRIGLDIYRRDGNLVYALVETRGDGQGLYRSTDRGESWEQLSEYNPRPMYFSLVRVDPNDPERIWAGGVSLGTSTDGGRTFERGDAAEGIHVDHHALWIDPNDSDHIILGSDGGISSTFDRGRTWRHHNNLAIGQFYEVGLDNVDPYNVCGGLQDNSSWCGPSHSLTSYGIQHGNWRDVSGGDGFYNRIDPTNPDIVYTESQGGNVSRVNVATGEVQRIRPQAWPGADGEERSYRFNWNTPIAVSHHDNRTVYLGSNHLMRSRDQGVTWAEVSPDLSRGIDRDTLEIMGARVTRETLSRHDGQSNYGTLTSISESPLDADVLWAGTDDGNVQVTRDGGATWREVSVNAPGLPRGTYVSGVEASHHAPGRAYASFDGHWHDDYRPHVYVTEDYGASWQRIVGGLPDESVNRVREHPRTPELLFVGNEVGVFASFDRGGAWVQIDGGLPTVPVDDIQLHPRENDLVLGTHGRSIWILDDIAPLEGLARGALANAAHLFPVRTATQWFLSGGWPFWADSYAGENPRSGALIRYLLGGPVAAVSSDDADQAANVSLEILDAAGTVIRTLEGPATPGVVHEVRWDFRHDPLFQPEEGQAGGGGGRFGGGSRGPLAAPGTYAVRLAGAATVTTVADAAGVPVAERAFEVRLDPRVRPEPAAQAARQRLMFSADSLAVHVGRANAAASQAQEQLDAARAVLEGAASVPDALRREADEVRSALADARQQLGPATSGARAGAGAEGTAGRPTADQLRAVEEGWDAVPEAVVALNLVVTERIPALLARIYAADARPAPIAPVPVPVRGR
ncbi:MAG: hypothetical protein WEB88_06715 [Gemmatimonadota bacterium]